MSNVKVNGNTYNGVTSVKLALADDSGYAIFTEGEPSGDDYMDQLLRNFTEDTFKGYENSEVTGEVTLSWLNGVNAPNAEVSLPNVTKISGGFGGKNPVLKAIKLPKAANFNGGNDEPWFIIRGTFELLDFSGIQTGTWNQTFYGCRIGTLKLGKFDASNGAFQNATITNLIWNNPDITADKMAGDQGLNCPNAKITNAYVPDGLYDEIKALMDAGTLTTVTNLYKISEWSDE